MWLQVVSRSVISRTCLTRTTTRLTSVTLPTPCPTLSLPDRIPVFLPPRLLSVPTGVDLILDYQIINVETCDPVPELYLDIWYCNATGVYAGVNNAGNGNTNDLTNIDKTFGRGIQQTDEDGVAQFETLFPGHYVGRITHIHLLAYANATLFKNKTLGNEGYSSYIGQTYFDQDLIYEDYDPVVEWTLLGDTVEEGVFGWLAYGVNITVTNKVVPAVFRYEDGGHANPDFGAGGGPGGPGGPPPPEA
ncbi:hypothetical protein LB507_007499, partial [Fusarium sp. FIESC RH6]